MASLGFSGVSRAAGESTAIVHPVVLVVDDDPGVCAALVALLVPRLEPFFRVETAGTAEDALEVLDAAQRRGEQQPLALVITDELMPGLTGTDLLIALRQHPEHRDGGRVVITAYASLAAAKRAINDAGVDGYFPKPWDAEGELLPAVGRILSRFVARRGLDRFLVASKVRSKADVEAIGRLRHAWWSFVTLAEDQLDVAGRSADEPPVDEPENSVTFVVHRIAAGEETPVAAARLHEESPGVWILDGMAFAPEEATQEVESLLVRTALSHAATLAIATVRTAAPALRRKLYQDLGFTPTLTRLGSGSTWIADPQIDPPGSILVQIDPQQWACETEGDASACRQRYASEGQLCACFQRACPLNDYAADVRSYYCPLDIHQGRVPAGFPAARP
jgi:CheY-like chemotaxis protein